MVHICDCIPARIRHALNELPETLDETYERTLRGINKANWEFAYRMFQFVSVASRPLRVNELADLLAFDFEAGSIPKFHEVWRLEDPVDAVLSTCSTLITIAAPADDDDERLLLTPVAQSPQFPVIEFSHFSVKEFLTSTRLAEANRHYLPPLSHFLWHRRIPSPHKPVWEFCYIWIMMSPATV